MLLKNTAGQKLLVFAYDRTTLLGKSGDAANITGYVSLDGGAGSSLGTCTEIDATNMPGWYYFAPSSAQTNGDAIAWSASSSTTNIGVDSGAGYTFDKTVNVTQIAGQTVGATGAITFYPNVGAAQPINQTGTSTAALVKVDVVDWQGATGPSITGDPYALLNTKIPQPIQFTGATGAGFVKVDVVDWQGATGPAMTGDAFARLGVPTSASIAADIANNAAQIRNVQVEGDC